MTYSVLLHPDVIKYLDSLEDRERKKCYETLKHLGENPYTSRPGCDIKKLMGKRKTVYRLRIGDHRFIYIIKNDKIFVEDAFRRGRGY